MDGIMCSLSDPRNATLLGKIAAIPAENYISPLRAIGRGETIFGKMSDFEKAAYTHCQRVAIRLFWNAHERDDIKKRADWDSAHYRAKKAALLSETMELRREEEEAQKFLNASIWKRTLHLERDGRGEVFPFIRQGFVISFMRG